MRNITIHIALNESTGLVESLDMVEGVYDRTKFVDECDKPICIRHALAAIRDDIEWSLK